MKFYRVSEEARNYARKVLRCHNYEAKQIKSIEESLRHPYRETDENIGGSHVSSNIAPQEAEAERVWTNEEFLSTVRHVEIVKNLIEDLSDDAVELLQARYLSDDGSKCRRPKDLPNWVKVSKQIHLSEDACKKKDTMIVTTLARRLKLK
ncbi:hypothetical protein PMV48_05775 [Enterococcus avium]|uniref:hypothetical protein n=1 Tax=Enterococcus avium TaxID=33945 RepID=UPI0006604C88|nr:hypothetical protein [Enterococcus avium]MDB1723271.1 hypothetical protein [Enterococcus avium]MDT2398673.1 hypothetical protein [Enterococcus avium]HAQ8926882.1 hypothetical protein [Enterococcus faecium]